MKFLILLFFIIFGNTTGIANDCIRKSLNTLIDAPAAQPQVTPFLSPSEIISKFPELTKTLKTMEKAVPSAKKINHPRKIPFKLSNDFRNIQHKEMVKRAEDLAPEISNTIKAVYNTLNDPKILNKYFHDLFIETAQWMEKKGKPEYLKLLEQGIISKDALQVVLIRRFKARKDTKFTILTEFKNGKYLIYGKKNKDIKPQQVKNEKEAFRVAVRTGPFIDRGVNGSLLRDGHGIFTHLIQRDIVSDVIKAEMNGDPQKFWNFLGSKKGVNWWADIFDSGDATSIVNPESLNEFISHTMLEKFEPMTSF